MQEVKKMPAAASGDAEAPEFQFAKAESMGYLLRQAYRTFNKVLQAHIAADHVTIGMWNYLRVLWDEDGLTQRELEGDQRIAVNPDALGQKHPFRSWKHPVPPSRRPIRPECQRVREKWPIRGRRANEV